MKCEKIERWISDDLDTSLPSGKRQKLESHLKACRACREYRRELQRIQVESQHIEGPEVSAECLEALSAGVVQQLRLDRQPERAGSALRWSLRWARVTVPAVLALALGVIFLRGRVVAPEDDMLSLEGLFDRVAWELAGDAELAAGFNRIIVASLVEKGDLSLPSDDIYIWNEPYFWESLSDEELRLIEEELKKGIRS